MAIVIRLIALLLITTTTFAASKHQITSYTDVGNGKAIVLIHAFPTDQRLWQPQQQILKSHYRVITLDLPGFGKAETTDGSAITMTEYADQVKQLLTRLQINKAIIGGESMGGYIALAFLQKYPESVEGLILSDTQAIADTAEMKEKREASARDVLEHGTTNLVNSFMARALSNTASDETKNYLRTIVKEQSTTGIASALRGMALRHDTSDALAKTSIPVLIMYGEQDTLISTQESDNMHALAKNSQLFIIKDAGHLSSLEQPQQWNAAVAGWVDAIK